MITLTKNGNAIVFTFEDNAHYLFDGTISVPVNSLTLITDNSQMATFKKSASNDVFISATYAELGMSKADLESWFKENACGSTGGGGGGVTSGEVETMIEASLEDYYDIDEVDTALANKADTSAVTEAISSAVSGKVNTSAFNTYSAATDARIAEDEEVTAAALNNLDEKIGDPYQKVSGLTIETDEEDLNLPPRIFLEAEGDGQRNENVFNRWGIETYQELEDGSSYSSGLGGGTIYNGANDYADENVTSERNFEISTDGFRQYTFENYDDGESSYTRYQSDNEFNYGNGLILSQQWYDEKNDTTTNSNIDIINNMGGDTYIGLTDHNERTVTIYPNALSWDDGRDNGEIEWSNIATIGDVEDTKAYYINFATIDSMRDEDWNGIVAAIDDHRPIYAGFSMGGGAMLYYGVEYMNKNSGNTEIVMAVSDNENHYFYTFTKNGSNDYSFTVTTKPFVTQAEKTAWNNKSDFSGDYNDLTNKPTITSAVTSGSTDSEIPTAKAVYDAVGQGGGSITVDSALDATSENPVQNKVIYAAIGDIESLLSNI